jgi:hypothetical protein
LENTWDHKPGAVLFARVPAERTSLDSGKWEIHAAVLDNSSRVISINWGEWNDSSRNKRVMHIYTMVPLPHGLAECRGG